MTCGRVAQRATPWSRSVATSGAAGLPADPTQALANAGLPALGRAVAPLQASPRAKAHQHAADQTGVCCCWAVCLDWLDTWRRANCGRSSGWEPCTAIQGLWMLLLAWDAADGCSCRLQKHLLQLRLSEVDGWCSKQQSTRQRRPQAHLARFRCCCCCCCWISGRGPKRRKTSAKKCSLSCSGVFPFGPKHSAVLGSRVVEPVHVVAFCASGSAGAPPAQAHTANSWSTLPCIKKKLGCASVQRKLSSPPRSKHVSPSRLVQMALP